MHTSFLFIQNAIMSISKIYPELLSNNADFFKLYVNIEVSDNHNYDIEVFLNKFYKPIEKFKGDTSMLQLLNSIKIKLLDMNNFIKAVPLYTEIQKVKNQDDEYVTVKFHSLFNQTPNMNYLNMLL